jgi:hypothetical protein
MTTTRNTKCTDCGFRPQDRSVLGPKLCTVCLDYADMENVHQDFGNDHNDDYPTAKCPVCHPELDRRYVRRTRTVTGPIAQTAHRSHKGCGHPLTPAHRALCRANGGPASA